MAGDQILRIVMQVVGAGKVVSTFRNMNNELSRVGGITAAVNDSLLRQSKRINASTEFLKTHTSFFKKFGVTATAGLQSVNKATKQVDKSFKRVNRKAVQFLGLGLGMLFAGMALQKFFGGFLRAAFNTFKTVIDAETKAFQKTQELNAAWQFLKFSIIAAL